MIKMDEVNKMRKAFHVDGFSVNEIAHKFKRAWGTVNEIVKTPLDELDKRDKQERKRESTVATQEVKDAIIHYLEKEMELGIKKKQRFRANVIFNELKKSGIYTGSIRRMQELVKDARKLYGQIEPKSYLPLEFPLGSALQMDHGEVDCLLGGFRMLCYLLVASIPGTTIRYCQLYGTKAQEAWGDFHEKCFQFFSGIFFRVIYDNDTVLITDCSHGKHIETKFALALHEHYRFESVYCNPASGNEKGSVENGVGFCRRNYLPGLPSYSDFGAVNHDLAQRCLDEIDKGTLTRAGKSTKDILEEVRGNLKPLLPERKWRQRLHRHVSSYQMIEYQNHFYSVPEQFVGTELKIAIGAFTIEIQNKEELVCEHDRMFAPGADSLILDHYLDQLRRKPGALWDCKVTKGLLEDKALEAIWERLIGRNPVRKARKDFIEILYLRKKYTKEDWQIAIDKTLKCGAYDATSIESIIRMLHTEDKTGDEKAVSERLEHLSVIVPIWECNLSEYAILSQVVSNKGPLDDFDIDGAEASGLQPHISGISRHNNAMLGPWNGPIADQIMDDYYADLAHARGIKGGEQC
jgi:transposase